VVTSLRQLAAGLQQRGHRVVIIVAANGGSDGDDPNVRVYRFPLIPLLPSVELGVGLTTPGRIQRILQREGIEVLHTHTEFWLARAALRAAERLGLPHMHTLHTTYEEYRHYLPGGALLSECFVCGWWRRFLTRFNAVICPSERSRRFVRRCAPGVQVGVVPNGMDTNAVSPTGEAEKERAMRRRGLPKRAQVLLYCGRLAREKRTEVLLEVLVPLLRERQHLWLVLVGGGPEAKKLRRSAAAAGVGEQLVVTGYLPWEEALSWYAAADLFVTASLSENHPMTLIEAHLAGLPAVGRRDPGIAAILREGRSGLLADSDWALQDCCRWLCDHGEERRRMGREARRLGLDLSRRGYAQKVEQEYRLLCTDPTETAGTCAINETKPCSKADSALYFS